MTVDKRHATEKYKRLKFRNTINIVSVTAPRRVTLSKRPTLNARILDPAPSRVVKSSANRPARSTCSLLQPAPKAKRVSSLTGCSRTARARRSCGTCPRQRRITPKLHRDRAPADILWDRTLSHRVTTTFADWKFGHSLDI